MAFNEKHLKGLLDIIDKIYKVSGNEWFFEILLKKYSNSNTSCLNVDIADIKRTKHYLKNIDKGIYVEAFAFYKLVKDTELKQKLIADYKEMRISFLNNDILEYGRRLYMQLERCFNSTIELLDAWEVIKSNTKFHGNFTLTENITIDFRKNFFTYNDNIEKRRDIFDIKFRPKAAFCCSYYGINHAKHWPILEDIYLLRTAASHGASASSKDTLSLNKIYKNFNTKFSLYHNMLIEFTEPLKILNK